MPPCIVLPDGNLYWKKARKEKRETKPHFLYEFQSKDDQRRVRYTKCIG